MPGSGSGTQPPAACRRGRHVMVTERLRLLSPSRSDMLIMRAAASDHHAQQWLGWPAGTVVKASRRDSLLAQQPGQGRPLRIRSGHRWFLSVIDRSSGIIAGGIGGYEDEVGGWLAPALRGHGLGAELFAAAAHFAHYHLSEAHVFAGTEPANKACIGALLSAGAPSGPADAQLPRAGQSCRRLTATWPVRLLPIAPDRRARAPWRKAGH